MHVSSLNGALLLLALASPCARSPETQSVADPQSRMSTQVPVATPDERQAPASAPSGIGIGHPEEGASAAQSLLEAGVVGDARRDAAIRALLGADDYRYLVETTQLTTQGEAPGLQTFAVRGLHTVMEAALQQDGDTLRVALLRLGDEVRWYSSDPATRSAPPDWFDAWRARFADKPVRLMSVPGAPLLPASARGG